VNRVVVDFIIVWKPRPGIPVDLLDVEEKILIVAKLYDVETVTYDRWNSAAVLGRRLRARLLVLAAAAAGDLPEPQGAGPQRHGLAAG
jgi:hypothetical protein